MAKIDPSEGDVNLSPLRKRWQAQNLDDATRSLLAEDARYFLGKGTEKYDYIVLDVFSGDVTPPHVLSREAFSLIKNRLTDNGVFAMNIIGSLKKDSVMTLSVIKTLESVFANTMVMPLFHPGKKGGYDFGNIAVFAGASRLPAPGSIMIDPSEVHPAVFR